MKKYLILLSAVLLVITVSSCGRNKNGKTEEKKLPLVKTTVVKGEYFEENYNIVGTVKPFESAKLSSEEGGLITYLTKDKGSRVSKGEVVVKLKKDVDEATYNQAIAQFELAKENFTRTEKLYADGVATEQQYTNAKLQMEIALKSVDLYRTRLSKGYIVSPIYGVVDGKYMNKGEMTSPGAPIVSIVNVSKVKISCGVPERYIAQVSRGEDVTVTFAVFPDEKFDARINYVSPTINAQNRTFEVELVIDNKNGKLKPEMSANITFTNMKVDNVIVLPQEYVVDNGEEKFVFVLEGNVAKKRVLKLGGRSDNKVLVDEGLNIGDTLINVGFYGLNDGDNVKVIN